MKLRKIAAASLAAVLTATNVAVVANAEAGIFNPDKTIVRNGVKYHIFSPTNYYPQGHVVVDAASRDITEAVILPEIEGVKVDKIGGIFTDGKGRGFFECTKLKKITIPRDVVLIGGTSFGNLSTIEDIYYEGSKEEWEELMKKTASDDNPGGSYTPFKNCKNLTMHYNYKYTAADYGDDVPDDNSNTSTTDKTYTPTVTANDANEETKSILNGISVTDKNGAFPDGVVMNVTAKDSTDTSFSFDITFTKDGKEVQPSGKVSVKVPLPEALKGGKVYVHHTNANGKMTLINSKADGDYVVFETDKFSVYTLSSKKLAELDPGATDVDPGDTNINTVPETPSKGNPDTGIALAIAPAVLAGAAVIVLKKKL